MDNPPPDAPIGSSVLVTLRTARAVQGVVLPADAVVRSAEGPPVVFEHATAERFIPRQVRVQPLDGTRVVVTAGLEPGKRVVVQGEEDAYLDAPEAVLAVALGNLIGNACKYTVEGEVRIDVSAHCIRVLDTGPGLSREDAEHLFERGYRGSGAGGTTGGGIGLSIVRRLCDLYGWAPSVQPRDEGGAIATLDFRSSQTGSSQP